MPGPFPGAACLWPAETQDMYCWKARAIKRPNQVSNDVPIMLAQGLEAIWALLAISLSSMPELALDTTARRASIEMRMSIHPEGEDQN